MDDRLADIKDNLHARVYGPVVSDVSWLVQEVERLTERTNELAEENRRFHTQR